MPNSMRSKEETTQYLSDKDNMKVFVRELHEYLTKHIKCTLIETEEGKKELNCDIGCLFMDGDIQLQHFIRFCRNTCLDWEAADDVFQRIPDRYWSLCDAAYLYSLKVDDAGNAYSVEVNPIYHF